MAQKDQASKIVKQDEEEENTQSHDNIQKHNISGVMANPNDTDGSSGATHGSMPESVDPSLQAQLEDEGPKAKDNQPRRASASPQRRTTRPGLGHEHSVEHSPLHHHHHQARVANKGGSNSPSWERKVSSGSNTNTPVASRLRVGGRADESPEESFAVPKFGEWEDDPSSADGFTGIFNKVREEKQTSATKVPALTNDSAYLNNYHHVKGSKRSTAFCCFNWGKK